jgi:hypothetical protein
MNEYAIELFRNGQSIIRLTLDADGAIEIIRSLHAAATHEPLAVSAESGEWKEPRSPAQTRKDKKGKGCSLCGKPGHNRKTCGKRNQDDEDDDAPRREFVMPRHKFEQVKISSTHEIPSDVVARELHVPLDEVNKAIVAKDYESYSS